MTEPLKDQLEYLEYLAVGAPDSPGRQKSHLYVVSRVDVDYMDVPPARSETWHKLVRMTGAELRTFKKEADRLGRAYSDGNDCGVEFTALRIDATKEVDFAVLTKTLEDFRKKENILPPWVEMIDDVDLRDRAKTWFKAVCAGADKGILLKEDAFDLVQADLVRHLGTDRLFLLKGKSRKLRQYIYCPVSYGVAVAFSGDFEKG